MMGGYIAFTFPKKQSSTETPAKAIVDACGALRVSGCGRRRRGGRGLKCGCDDQRALTPFHRSNGYLLAASFAVISTPTPPPE